MKKSTIRKFKRYRVSYSLMYGLILKNLYVRAYLIAISNCEEMIQATKKISDFFIFRNLKIFKFKTQFYKYFSFLSQVENMLQQFDLNTTHQDESLYSCDISISISFLS